MSPARKPARQHAVDAAHLRATLADALEHARRRPGGLVAALRELRLSVLALEHRPLAELPRRKGPPRA